MGLGTIVGCVACLVAIFGAMIMEGGNPGSLVAPPALLLILVGSFGAACGGTSLEAALDALKAVKDALTYKVPETTGLVERMAGYAEVARRDGVLALEGRLGDEPDPLLKRGLRLVLDGFPLDDVRGALTSEAMAARTIWKRRADFFSKMGAYGPTMGIIGTVLGLIEVLESLGGDPGELGHLIAAAFIATFFGVMFANVFFLPIGNKFTAIADAEGTIAKVTIEGVLAIGSGSTPRNLREALSSKLEPKEREALRLLAEAA